MVILTDDAAREAEAQAQALKEERDELTARIQALQEAVKTRDQDWTAKVRGLEQCGIRVAERVPHIFPSNQHNTQYLVTKARRLGHMF